MILLGSVVKISFGLIPFVNTNLLSSSGIIFSLGYWNNNLPLKFFSLMLKLLISTPNTRKVS